MSIRIGQRPRGARNNNCAKAPCGLIFRGLPRASQFGSRRIAICPTYVALNIHTLPTARLCGNANHRGHHESAKRARAKNRELENHAHTNHEARTRPQQLASRFWEFLPPRSLDALLQQRVAELKESTAKNKQALAQYTWVEKVTVYLKGEQKKRKASRCAWAPTASRRKLLSVPRPLLKMIPAHAAGGRLRQRIVAKKKEEYEDYAEQMKTLGQQYLPPDKDAIQAAYAKGNVSVTPSDAAPGEVKIVIVNYVKPGDSMTLLFDKEQKQIRSIKIASYMDNPSDAMNLAVQFDRLPDGTSHASTAKIEGVSKQLTINTQNSDYRKL